MKKFFITILTLLLLFSFTACGEAKESSPKLKEWSAPEYSDVTYGATVTVLPVSVRDTEENVYNAVVKSSGSRSPQCKTGKRAVYGKCSRGVHNYLYRNGGGNYRKQVYVV